MKRLDHAFNVASHADVDAPEPIGERKHDDHAENIKRNSRQKPFWIGAEKTPTELGNKPRYMFIDA